VQKGWAVQNERRSKFWFLRNNTVEHRAVFDALLCLLISQYVGGGHGDGILYDLVVYWKECRLSGILVAGLRCSQLFPPLHIPPSATATPTCTPMSSGLPQLHYPPTAAKRRTLALQTCARTGDGQVNVVIEDGGSDSENMVTFVVSSVKVMQGQLCSEGIICSYLRITVCYTRRPPPQK